MKIPELLALFVIVVLIVNMVLLALGRISVWFFFLILGISGLISYKGIPWMRRL